MKIIQIHNYYQQVGGEDAVVAAERSMLDEHGHQIVTYYRSNDSIAASSNKLLAIGQMLKACIQTIWNDRTHSDIRALLRSEKPDIVHCHNTFPLISPSIYWACAKEKVPVVQTLHNYRLLCLNAFLFKQSSQSLKVKDVKNVQVDKNDKSIPTSSTCHDFNDGSTGAICELCVQKKFKWPGIHYRCYRNSLAGSLVVALMLCMHKLLGTWAKRVTAYIALTEFQKKKMIEGGLSAEKIFVKPNFVDVNTEERGKCQRDAAFLSSLSLCDKPYCLFVGRLSAEKGCDVLVRAWAKLQKKLIANDQQLAADLIVVGDGPERASLEALAAALMPNAQCPAPGSIRFLGHQSKKSVLLLMNNAQFVVSPSICYETFGLVVLEAGIEQTPAIVSQPGTVASLIDDGRTGLLFPMGDVQALADKMDWAFAHLDQMKTMGLAAKKEFIGEFSSEHNYELLIRIYKEAIRRCYVQEA